MSAASRGAAGESLPRQRRITRGSEIRAILRRGKRSRTAHLDVIDSPSPASHPRAGVIVARYGHGAVERNRVKRRLREIVRRRLLPGLAERGYRVDVLVRARRGAYDAPYAGLQEELMDWLARRCSGADC